MASAKHTLRALARPVTVSPGGEHRDVDALVGPSGIGALGRKATVIPGLMNRAVVFLGPVHSPHLAGADVRRSAPARPQRKLPSRRHCQLKR